MAPGPGDAADLDLLDADELCWPQRITTDQNPVKVRPNAL